MRNILLSLFILSWCFSLGISAQNTHLLGYCSDDLEGADVIGIEGEARLSAAIRLPKATMQRYKDGKIVRIQVALREGVEKASVWIRKALGESSVVVQSLGTVQYGWNELTLNEPLTVDGDELYIGYTFTQPDGVRGILAKGSGDENTSLVAVDNQWADYHNDGVGILFIRAVVEAELPYYDMAVIDGSTDSLCYAAGSEMNASVCVENLGTQNVSAYTLSWSLDGGEPVSDGVTYSVLAPMEMQEASKSFSLQGLEEGEHFVEVTLSAEGVDDGRTANNTLRIPFFVYSSTYPHTLLLEHFTSLPCVNCPPVDKLLEQVVQGRSDVAWVAHHVGYRNDEFTIEASEPYLKFGVYGNPFIMIDRSQLVGDTPAFTIGGFSASDMQTVFGMAAEKRAFVSLMPELTIENRRANVLVRGEAKSFFQTLFPRATINVFLVEDNVLAVGSQAGDATKKYHDNVLRAVLTRQAGDRIQWTDDTHFSQSFSIDVDDAWTQGSLRVVAFVTAQADRATGYPTGAVLNAAQNGVSIGGGISSAVGQESGAPHFYTLGGQPVTAGQLKPGLYIVEKGGSVSKIVIR